MCLIYFANRIDPRYRLLVAANRDEFHERETAAVHWWQDAPDILAGRDLRAGGTWMGVSLSGRFAALTNFRDAVDPRADAISRGALVSNFLQSSETAEDYLAQLAQGAQRFNGFSLLVDDGQDMAVYSNRGCEPSLIRPGVHGLSNHFLDTPWPKVSAGSAELTQIVSDGQASLSSLLALLNDRNIVADAQLPNTGIGHEREKALSARFIQSPDYGTRSSTALLIDHDGQVSMQEQRFNAQGELIADKVHKFEADKPL